MKCSIWMTESCDFVCNNLRCFMSWGAAALYFLLKNAPWCIIPSYCIGCGCNSCCRPRRVNNINSCFSGRNSVRRTTGAKPPTTSHGCNTPRMSWESKLDRHLHETCSKVIVPLFERFCLGTTKVCCLGADVWIHTPELTNCINHQMDNWSRKEERDKDMDDAILRAAIVGSYNK